MVALEFSYPGTTGRPIRGAVRQTISRELEAYGIGHIPSELPGDQNEPMRLCTSSVAQLPTSLRPY